MSVDGNKLLNLAGAQVLYNNLREILDTKLNNSLKGTPNGLAELDSSGKVPASQLPSYVDDVVEFTRLSSFPVPGQGGKIYVALDTNLTYRWSGTSYVQISSALALGETSTTAYRGDRGAAAYNHANNKGSSFSNGLYKITTNSQGHVTNATPVVKQDITKLGILDTVPTKTSELVNDSGFITDFVETDPTVPAWAKATTKPTYTAVEVGALPNTTSIPTKVSQLTNDAGYLTAHQDISGKADKNEIPTKVSDLTNDSGFITSYTETDPTVPAWAKATTKPSYTANEVGALPSTTVIPNKTSDLQNDSSFITDTELNNLILIQNTQPVNNDNKIWIPETAETFTQIPTMEDIPTKISDLTNDAGYYIKPNGGIPASDLASGAIPDLTNYVQNTDYASASEYGVVKVGARLAVESGALLVQLASTVNIKAGTTANTVLVPSHQHEAAFYGLATAAGDTTQSASSNAVGTYTEDAKASIQTMLGVDGCVKNTNYASTNVGGVVKTIAPFYTDANGVIGLTAANSDHIKNGVNTKYPVTPSKQNEAVFYGLAKAAGDTTQTSSNNAVGTYTDSAKNAIKEMLDVGMITETVSGMTPTITAAANHHYICGEVTSLSFTPSASDVCDVRFTSGSTATALTVPNTVKWPSGFNPTALETNTIYRLSVQDGIYGMVTTWLL